MANKKISELASATTPLSGAELIEIVQSGTNKQVAASALIGAAGPEGDPGAPGADGLDGSDGAAGADGADGRTVLSGTGAPSSGLGANGDFYIDTTDWDIYGPKTAGAWGAGTSLIGSSAANLATVAHAATSKTSPVDADELSLIDSAASYGLKKLTWANLKATIWSSLGALIAAGTEKSTPVDADTIVISDSAASAATKKLSITSLWVNYLKAKADALYPTLTATNSFRASQTLLSETGAAITLNIYGDGSGANILNRRYSDDIIGCTYTVAKARGSYASPSPVNAGDITGSVAFQGYGGSSFRSIAAIFGMVEAYVSDTNISGYLSFRTNAGSTGVTEKARLKSNGDFVLTSSGLLGYDAGSGGAVTQATSRTTGVTLNTSNGAITLVSAAGSTTFASFTVTNSLVAATDCVIVNQKSGTDLYEIHVTNVAAGSFKISYRTISGSTTEQPVFNFAVIKGVTS